jgi:Zn-dependent M28 family amino/carboxypeptidase
MKKLLGCAAAFAALSTAALAAPRFDAARILNDVKVLSSDAFEGRGPVSPGETKTVDYLIAQAQAAGLQPAGDKQKGGSRAWTQDVPLARFATQGPVKVSVDLNGKVESWTQGQQIAIRAAQTGQTHLTIDGAPVVFLGYGVKAPERKWDDYKGVNLKGKVGLVLVNDPDFETGSGDFGGKAMTYYGRWTYKYEEAARQHALGILVIHETAPASYGWATVKNSNINEIFDVIRKKPLSVHAPLEGWVQRDAAVEMLKAAGLDFEALKTQAQTRAFKPVELTGVTFSTDFGVDVQKVTSHNVVGQVVGSEHPDERVIYTAHWDHLGVGAPDDKGDRIYNGALDNASGTAEMLELARAFGHGPQPKRTVMFMWVTAEEKGLLGSEYYAANPLYPLATTVANINMDGVRPDHPARDISISGNAPLTLTDDLIAVAKARGRSFTPDPRPEAGSFYRSDHFSFAKRGVPALSVGDGQDFIDGGRAAGKAYQEAYTRDRYHQPADEYDPSWTGRNMVAQATVMYDLGWRLANTREWPDWKPGAEFKAQRDKTKRSRRN